MEDRHLRFYAIMGASISFGSLLDQYLYRVFNTALQRGPDLSATLYYAHRNVGGRRDAADAAVRAVCLYPALSARWEAILADLTALTGNKGARNLVSHNPVSQRVIVSLGGGGVSELPIIRQTVPGQSAKEETFDSLLAYAGNQLRMMDRLGDFTGDLHKWLAEQAQQSRPE